ncbi:MAG: biotin/lipoyl-containing protein, partial [Solirubrobacteraceae bacterium]
MAVDTSTVQVVMPAMGDSVAEGTVLTWHKQEGDAVQADETIVEISTDKVDAEVPAPVAGTVAKLYAAEGDTVAVGALLAEIETNGRGPAAPAEPEADGAAAEPEADAPAAEPEAATAGGPAAGVSSSEDATIVDIVTPTGGESVTEGTILEWRVQVGGQVADGDTVVEISTDKVDMELPAPASGTLVEILAGDGETVSVGQVIGRLAIGAGDGAAPSASTAPAPA